ncbi:hypothetical protein SeMB42_g02253 [Synchytrium endobioticum]|uniref:Uncharacterized protein n=1 Tax=Synchytrium endobioticum TaxID=286115 RepID=A0A507CB32_9FUNG|nr:hypothetical protein SeLEV6574_g08075 [Synchytrium endobioticum]TPX50447.1 hypothetical protein SeMB42_g02253 [Synchytrium endobioticum]
MKALLNLFGRTGPASPKEASGDLETWQLRAERLDEDLRNVQATLQDERAENLNILAALRDTLQHSVARIAAIEAMHVSLLQPCAALAANEHTLETDIEALSLQLALQTEARENAEYLLAKERCKAVDLTVKLDELETTQTLVPTRHAPASLSPADATTTQRRSLVFETPQLGPRGQAAQSEPEETLVTLDATVSKIESSITALSLQQEKDAQPLGSLSERLERAVSSVPIHSLAVSSTSTASNCTSCTNCSDKSSAKSLTASETTLIDLPTNALCNVTLVPTSLHVLESQLLMMTHEIEKLRKEIENVKKERDDLAVQVGTLTLDLAGKDADLVFTEMEATAAQSRLMTIAEEIEIAVAERNAAYAQLRCEREKIEAVQTRVGEARSNYFPRSASFRIFGTRQNDFK